MACLYSPLSSGAGLAWSSQRMVHSANDESSASSQGKASRGHYEESRDETSRALSCKGSLVGGCEL
jgi:hypothetical protein